MATIKRMMTDPELFLEELEKATEETLDHEFAQRFKEWKARGASTLIRSSSLGTCVRQSYYSHFDNVERTPVSDPVARRRMFLGFVNEETMGRILERIPGTTHGLESKEQNEFPIHLEMTSKSNLEFGATTDFVKTYDVDHPDAKDNKAYIPLELKSTEVYKWKEFTYWKYHLKQLLLWIYIAKTLGYYVPYGVLLYTRRSTMEMKTCMIPVDSKFAKMGRVIESYEHWKPYIQDVMIRLQDGILTKKVPEKPTDVPLYICKSCPHLRKCDNNMN